MTTSLIRREPKKIDEFFKKNCSEAFEGITISANIMPLNILDCCKCKMFTNNNGNSKKTHTNDNDIVRHNTC